jgi:hypothetical protein
MAMKYGGEYRFDRIRRRHLERLAQELAISPSTVLARVNDLCCNLQSACREARVRLPDSWRDAGILDGVEEVVRGTTDELLGAVVEPA